MMFDEATKQGKYEEAMANKQLLDIAEVVANKMEGTETPEQGQES